MRGSPLGLAGISTPVLKRTLAHLHRGELDFPLGIVGFTRLGLVAVHEQVLDAACVEAAGAPHEAHDDVALRQQQLREIAAVLARDSGYERRLSV